MQKQKTVQWIVSLQLPGHGRLLRAPRMTVWQDPRIHNEPLAVFPAIRPFATKAGDRGGRGSGLQATS